MNFQAPALMGIINCTPDSFYAPSRCAQEHVPDRVKQLIQEGASIIDIGGCSTRPGAPLPSAEEEWQRLEAGLKLLTAAKKELPPYILSIDTFRPLIVERAYALVGTFWLNDVSGGKADPGLLSIAARLHLPWVATHPLAFEGCDSMRHFFEDAQEQATIKGIGQIIFDPGFGFAKESEQDLEMLCHLEDCFPKKSSGVFSAPIMAGISRKRMTYKPYSLTPETALETTSALHLQLLLKGVDILRVHDVAAATKIIRLYQKMRTFVKTH